MPDQPLSKGETLLAIEKIQGLQENIDSFKARVFQNKKTNLFREEINTVGDITVKKPNLLYWEVEKPEKAIIVVDGEKIWIYHPELKEVQRLFLSQNFTARYAMKFFSSSIKETLKRIEKKFHLVVYDDSVNYLLELKPRSKLTKKYLSLIHIWIRKKDGIPVRFETMGKKKSHTVTIFKNVTINPKIEKDLFLFKIPKGVKVLSEDEDDDEEF